jgi:hypothetical protein
LTSPAGSAVGSAAASTTSASGASSIFEGGVSLMKVSCGLLLLVGGGFALL